MIKNRISELRNKSNYLRQIRQITNECLSNGAYSDSNMEAQFEMFQEKNVPDWEKDIISRAWNVKKTIAHNLLRELDTLLDYMEKYDNEQGKPKT